MTKVVFYSNYLNHHQLGFCKKLNELTNHSFKFVSQKAISEKRISFGYHNISNDYDFVVKTYEDQKYLKEAYDLSTEAEYVLFGSSNTNYLKERSRNNQLIIKYSERLFKCKLNPYTWLKAFRRVYINHTKYRNKEQYMLCSGSYAAYDFNRFGAYKNKTYKWAYFPTTNLYDIDSLFEKKNKGKIILLWAGRLLGWKHPELAIEISRLLKEDGYDFTLNLIGNGEKEEELKSLIKKYGLDSNVRLLGSMHPEEVREKMEEANIFLFTSDMQEGWGAVLNEAMNSGCACVSSHAIGSAGFLIKHKENGLIYKNGDINNLYENVKLLMNNPEYREKIGKNAYKTISEMWNAEEAAKRFLVLCDCLKNKNETPYTEGPCSRAVSISDKEMYNYLVK